MAGRGRIPSLEQLEAREATRIAARRVLALSLAALPNGVAGGEIDFDTALVDHATAQPPFPEPVSTRDMRAGIPRIFDARDVMQPVVWRERTTLVLSTVAGKNERAIDRGGSTPSDAATRLPAADGNASRIRPERRLRLH